MRWGWLFVALFIVLAACANPVPDARRSGTEDLSPSTRALQADDSQNPGMLWVAQGRAAFEQQCVRCHASASLRDTATRYPAWDTQLVQPISLTERVQQCRMRHGDGQRWTAEADELLALETHLAHAARGRFITPVRDGRLQPALAQGQALYQQRMGQLGLSCMQCHDQQAGKRLAGSVIPQGHPTGYPIYRLEWQGMGSLERRIRGCMSGVRAEPFAYGSEELTALALYLKQRAAGMAIETPAVRP
jgi:L-cysteine S-thiosulfotransferase